METAIWNADISYWSTSLSPQLLIQLSGSVLGKAMRDNPTTWTLASRMGHPDRVPGSWIQLTGLQMLKFGVMNQGMENFSFSHCLFLNLFFSLFLRICMGLIYLNKQGKNSQSRHIFKNTGWCIKFSLPDNFTRRLKMHRKGVNRELAACLPEVRH